ncbi:DUF805 domain-containing protein [Staphylococcus condimenti]|uniref:DUF805 domain-containing protein n=1 Tax=Staphylococcus condimenti TaxID=70255 RepID=A0AB37H146_9STAP|nr:MULTISPECIES: DUF805 domain-containing protein [Staphylococcus]AMY05980.1 hypothetical protein A4G25_08580 [Staphylococcus condimenti]APR59842.1 hypothetical protein BTZ13_00860 [Staphylococcus condimenti]MDK8644971.1 DUF805 domain-containing protein [Staphylococcus condimenti]OFP02986.1 hypothetical protein HMPREF3007_08180 [Staphylococcus sp. HMSC065E08]QQS82224.1 DUF805 domain-containing protein [Staphylococcus condimenti]
MKEQANFAQCFGLFWKNYFNFKGCATRREYWFTIAWLAIITIPVMLIGLFGLITFLTGISLIFGGALFLFITMFYFLASFVLLIPVLTLIIRRFHDSGKSMLLPILFTVMLMTIPYLPDLTFNQFGAGDITFLSFLFLVFHISFIPITIALGIYIFVVTLLPSKREKNKYCKIMLVNKHIEGKRKVTSFSKTLE